MEDLISVIIPAYNVEQYIGRCIESVIKQTYLNLEIIIVDDGTKDRSGDIAEEYSLRDNRIKVLHKINGGLSSARNQGIINSHGKYITFIDSDDYVDKEYIEYLVKIIKQYSTHISICQHKTVFPSGHIKDIGNSRTEALPAEEVIKRILYDDVLNTSAWAKLYDRELFNHVFYPEGRLFEDIGTTYKLIMQCETIAIGYETKYNYILRADSITYNKFTLKKLDLVAMTDEMASVVSVNYPALSKAVMRRRVYARFSTLNQMLDEREYSKQKNDMISFIRANRTTVLTDREAPLRDKIAIILLSISYSIYRKVWKTRTKVLM